ncbi:MAG TPA: phytoene/squalene synthase family protein [Mycobacteriales bacterium]|nr:phytoene/squalene synthase family protein [Mycobacteriales bacterium]
MSTWELDAAGIADPALRVSYRRCRELLARHGRTYHLATLLLPPAKRPFVQALYGFARHVDEMADRTDVGDVARAQALVAWTDRFLADLAAGHSDDEVGRAVVDTVRRWDIPAGYFAQFVDAMRSDLTVTRYRAYADLERYMHGAAGVIGLEMLPVLEPVSEEAWGPMRSMGLAFQLTNIVRDIGEDLDRGRVYLPEEDLYRFGVDRAGLERRVATPGVKELLRYEITRARALYAHAHTGVPLLHPTARDCIRTALVLYGDILGAVEAAGYDVLARRVRVGTARRLRVAGPALVRASWARRVSPGGVPRRTG